MHVWRHAKNLIYSLLIYTVLTKTSTIMKKAIILPIFFFSFFIAQSQGVTFSGKVYLQGAFNMATGNMNNALNTLGILQAKASSQPYNIAAFNNYNGLESVNAGFFAGHANIVDWILIELRDGIMPSTIVARRSAFVKQDGSIVDIDGSSPVLFTGANATSNYFVAIRHRNHLAVQSATAVNFTSGTGSYDFTTARIKAYENQNYTSTVQVGSVWVMRGGNANSNDNIKYNGPSNDQNQILNIKLNGSLSNILDNAYAAEDVNMNGNIKWNGPGNDQNFLLNTVLSGSLSTVSVEQISSPQDLNINPNVKTIDSNLYTLNADPTLIAQGIYEYTFSGTTPDFTTNDIIVGVTGKGYLRKVIGVTSSTNKIILQTSQASMEDAFEEALFSFSADLKNGMNQSARTTVEDIAYDLGGTVLYEDGLGSIRIESGIISMNADWNFDFDYKNSKIKSFTLESRNVAVKADANLRVQIADGKTFPAKNGSFKKFEKTFVRLIGYVPVVVTAILDFKYQFSGNTTASITNGLDFTSTNTFEMGVNYANNQWSSTYSSNSSATLVPTPTIAKASAQINLSITPEVSFEFYGIVGPYASVGLMEEITAAAAINLNTSVTVWDLYAGAWLKSIVGAKASLLGTSLFDYNKDWNTQRLEYKTPAIIIKPTASGDNQIGAANTNLPDQVSVRVLDLNNNPQSNVSVFFKVTSGGGSTSAVPVVTNADGIARATWKLGSAATPTQTLAAEIRNGTDAVVGAVQFAASVAPTVDTLALLRSKTWVASGQNVEGVAVAYCTSPAVSPPTRMYTFNGGTLVFTLNSDGSTQAQETINGIEKRGKFPYIETDCWFNDPVNKNFGGKLIRLNSLFSYSAYPPSASSCSSSCLQPVLWNMTIVSISATQLVISSTGYLGSITFDAQ